MDKLNMTIVAKKIILIGQLGLKIWVFFILQINLGSATWKSPKFHPILTNLDDFFGQNSHILCTDSPHDDQKCSMQGKGGENIDLRTKR